MTDRLTAGIGTLGTMLATYAGEKYLAAAIALFTLLAVIPKGAAGAYNIYKWCRDKIEK